MRRLKRKNAKRFKRFKHQALKPILSVSRRIKLKSKTKELLTFNLQF